MSGELGKLASTAELRQAIKYMWKGVLVEFIFSLEFAVIMNGAGKCVKIY